MMLCATIGEDGRVSMRNYWCRVTHGSTILADDEWLINIFLPLPWNPCRSLLMVQERLSRLLLCLTPWIDVYLSFKIVDQPVEW